MNLEEVALELAKELGVREARIHEREKRIERLDQQIDEKISEIQELRVETEQVQKDSKSKQDQYKSEAALVLGDLQVLQARVREAEIKLQILKQEHEDQLTYQRGQQAALVKRFEDDMADKRAELTKLNTYLSEGYKRFQPLKG